MFKVVNEYKGTAFKSKGELILAEKQYLKSIKLNYQVSESHNNLGNLYLDMNKYKESIKCYKEAIKINKKFFPTDRGKLISAFLEKLFTKYVDYSFTAKLEDQLDEITAGNENWIKVLENFISLN